MTGFENVAPEQLAKLFFNYHEALAPDFDCASYSYVHFPNGESWEGVERNERNLMVATARLVLLELACTARRSQSSELASSDASLGDSGRVEGTEGKECGC